MYSGHLAPSFDRRHSHLSQLIHTDYMSTSYQPRPDPHSPYNPPATASDFQAAINPISPVSSTPPLSDMKNESGSRIQIKLSNEEDMERDKTSPGWRPDWVKEGVIWISVTVLFILALYLALYMYGRQKSYIATSNPGTDVVFRFGPALLALIVAIMVGRLADDLAISQPYIALAVGKKSLQVQYGARLAEPSFKEWARSWLPESVILPKKLRKWYKLATLWCALVLVPLQTGLFTRLSIDGSPQSASFKVLELTELFHSAYRSEFAKSIIDAVYHGQSVTDFKWIAIMNQHDSPVQPGWAAVMPFHPSTGPQLGSGQDVHWKARTSAIWSYLDCVQLDNFEVTADSVSITDGARSANTVDLKLKTPDGCRQSFSWDLLSTSSPMSKLNPMSLDGWFALWANTCSDTTFVLISGPLAAQASRAYTSKGKPKSDWGGLSCRSDYVVNSNDIYYTVQSVGQGNPQWDSTPDTKDINVTSASWNGGKTDNNISTPIQANVVNTTLLYEVSSPNHQKTFWGLQRNNTFQGYLPNQELKFSCSESKPFNTDKKSWTNDRACGMYLMASDIWSLLVAATAASVALYVPDERWKDIKADVQTKRTAWKLTDFGFMYTVVLYSVVLFFLHMDKSLPSKIGRRGKGRRTGLAGSPSSIAGLAAVFRDPETRKLMEGIDALDPKEAVRKQNDIWGGTVLRLGRWRGHQGQPVAKPVKHQPLNAMEPAPELIEEPKQLEKLRYSRAPVTWWIVLLMFGFATVLIFVTLWFLILHPQSHYHMWNQALSNASSLGIRTIGNQVQKVFFTSLPALAMAIICLCWAEVDHNIRRTEPYKALRKPKGGKGSETVLLSYMHDWMFTIPFKAFRQRRWKLFYVTLVSLLLRTATLFWAGIFDMGIGNVEGAPKFQLLQDWRPSGFLENSTSAFADNVKNMAISRALYGYPSIPGWQTESYVFPSVDLTPGNYTVNLQGLEASLDCIPAEVDTKKNNAKSGWSATLKKGECAGATWPSACDLPRVTSDDKSDSGTIKDGQCIAWKYLGSKDCPQKQYSDTGRWWIFGLSGSIVTADHTFSGSNPSPNHVSILCTPKFSLDKVSVNIAVPLDSTMPTLSVVGTPTQHQDLPLDRWKNGNRTFASYTSELINKTLASKLQVISYTTYLDVISSIAALNLSSSTNGLFDAETLKKSSSNTFGALIATIISMNQTDPAAPSAPVRALLSRVTASGRVSASEQKQVAYLQKVPLWVAFISLCIFAVSLVGALFNKARSTPSDINYPANVLSLVYDSGLMHLMDDYPDNAKEIAELHFALGAFTGISGKRRLGIYILEWAQGH